MQMANIYIFLSPTLSTRLGSGGKRRASDEIQKTAQNRIKGLDPKQIKVVAKFATNPLLEGNKAEGFLSFDLYEGNSPDLIQGMIKDAAISKFMDVAGNPVEVSIDYGNTFYVYE